MSIHGRAARVAFIISTLVVASSLTARLQAQEWNWPEKPKNLQKLPKDWPGERLSTVMRGFTRALGVDCSHCHVGEKDQPLSTYDFASDENPNKDRARAMLDILRGVNDILETIEPSGEKRVNMWCHTCHRGRPRPTTLEEEMGQAYAADGIKGAIARYQALKEEFYGQGTFAFTATSLERAARALMESDPDGAIEILLLSTHEHPEAFTTWIGLGDLYAGKGKIAEAQSSYEKAKAIDPENEELTNFLDAKIAELKKDP